MITAAPVLRNTHTMKKDNLEIAGVRINVGKIDTEKVKTLDDVKALDIFSHLEGKEKADAEKELAGKLGIKIKGQPEPPAQG